MIARSKWRQRAASAGLGIVTLTRLTVLALTSAITLAARSLGPETTPVLQTEPPGDPVELAVSDLAQRLGVDRSAIVVLSVEDVTWPDSSLGCPEPGRAYIQVLTPGKRIRLGVDGKVYEYHSGRTEAPVYCDNPQPPVTGDRPGSGPGPLVVPGPTMVPMTESAPRQGNDPR
jgi:hypothetical protein